MSKEPVPANVVETANLPPQEQQARIEAALRQSEERLRLCLAAARMGIWTWDVAHDEQSRDGNLNRLLGLEPIETRQPMAEFFTHVHPDDREAVQQAFNASITRGETLRIEFRVVWPDGSIRWLRDQGDIFAASDRASSYMAGACADVTERRQAEAALRASEERLRSIVESATDFAIITLDPQSYITSWNPGAETIFGFRADEIIGQHASILFTPEDRAAGAVEQEAETARRQGRAADERWHVRRDGSRFYASGVMRMLHADPNAGFVKIARDLTDRQRTEDDLRQADQRKDEFLAMLGHELRNPLAAIKMGVMLLQSEKVQESTRSATIPIVASQVDHMQRLIDDLLDVSRMVQGQIQIHHETVTLQSVLQRALEMLRGAQIARHCAVRTEMPLQDILINGDPVRLTQIFTNILTNAGKYSSPQCEIEVKIVASENEAAVHVRDNGLGISPELLPHVFDLFVQSKRSRDRSEGGLGLGLNVVRKLVELHGGRVAAFSEGEGKGSEFVVHLPIARKES